MNQAKKMKIVGRPNSELPEVNKDIWPFGEDSEMEDLTLLVGTKRIHVNKTLLMLASPVFKAMFNAKSGFKEASLEEITLKDKTVDAVVAFLKCIHPKIRMKVDKSNASKILPLADEYQCIELKTECERVISGTIPTLKCISLKEAEQVLYWYAEAEKYQLKELGKTCLVNLKKTHSKYLTEFKKFGILKSKQLVISRARVKFLENKYKVT